MPAGNYEVFAGNFFCEPYKKCVGQTPSLMSDFCFFSVFLFYGNKVNKTNIKNKSGPLRSTNMTGTQGKLGNHLCAQNGKLLS